MSINHPLPWKKLNEYDPWRDEDFCVERYMQTQFLVIPASVVSLSTVLLLFPCHKWFFNGRTWNLYRRVGVDLNRGHFWQNARSHFYVGAYIPVFEEGLI